MNRKIRIRSFATLSLLFAIACDDGHDARRFSTDAQPVVLQDGLLYTRSDTAEGTRALLLDLSSDKPKVVPQTLQPGNVVSSARHDSAGGALLLTSGRDADNQHGKSVPEEPSHLVALDHAQPTDHKLSGRYTGLTVSDDGRFAVAYAPNGNLVRQNAIEVVDLEANTTTRVNLQLDGRSPTRFVFSPKQGFNHRFLILPFGGTILLLDLEHPELDEIAIPLSTDSSVSFTPDWILFAGDQVFVAGTGRDQVLVLSVLADATAKRGFQIASSLLTTRSALRDLKLIGSGAQLRLLALSTSLQWIDPARGNSTAIDGVSNFGRSLPFEGTAPLDAQTGSRAMLYAVGQSRVGFVDLGGDAAWATRSIDAVELGDPLLEIVSLAHHKLAIALHSTNRVSVIDLQTRRVDPYRFDAPVRSWLLDEDADHARFWTGTSTGKLGVIDLVTPDNSLVVPIELEADNQAVTADAGVDDSQVPSAGRLLLVPGAHPRVAILHDDSGGHVTLVDANAPSTKPVDLVGFFLAGLFD